MTDPSGAQLLSLVGHWLSLWLGLYLFVRRPRSLPTMLVGAAILSVSLYLLGTALLFESHAVSEATEWWAAFATSWVYFGPVLLLHGMLRLTRVRLPYERSVLALAYVAAAAVCAMSWSDTLIYVADLPELADADAELNLRPGPLYALSVVQVLTTLALALGVIVHRRLAAPRPSGELRRHLDLLLIGALVVLVATAAMFANAMAPHPVPEGFIQPLLLVGCLVLARPLARYSGLLEGQLLRSDLGSSLLGVTGLVAAFILIGLATGAETNVLAAIGWLIVAVYVLGDDVRALADRPFFKGAARAQRSGLRTTATFAGSSRAVDLDTLLPEQSSEVISLLAEVDRAGLASASVEGRSDVRLDLLGRDEFGPVRTALGLPPSWHPSSAVPRDVVQKAVEARLEPRERQALGLKYLGFSDKEMARLMDVRPNVPRSYLSAGKRKLGLSAGAPVMLFVHFAGLVESDALPLLAAGSRGDQAVRGDGSVDTDAATAARA